MMPVDLQRDQTTVRRQRAPHPYRAVAGERSDLENAPRAERTRDQVKKLALRRRDADRRQVGRVERGNVINQKVGDVAVGCGPLLNGQKSSFFVGGGSRAAVARARSFPSARSSSPSSADRGGRRRTNPSTSRRESGCSR